MSVTTESPATLDLWRELALPVLRRTGKVVDAADVDRILSTTTDDGVTIAPLYVDGPAVPEVHPAPGPWDVRQQLTDEADLADEVAGGTTSLWLVGEDVPPAVLSSGLCLVLDAGPQTEVAADALLRQLRDRPVPLCGNLGADPLGLAIRTNRSPRMAPLTRLARRCVDEHPPLRAATVDASVYHDAGAPDVLELAYALAAGVTYLRELTAAGLDVRTAMGQIEFRYAVGCDQWQAIAKLRAAQLLWTRVARAAGVAGPLRQRQHAVTSRPMMTARAPWTNIVRSTVAAFAAVVGGADAVTVLPHDACRGPSGADARRLARTTHAVLRLETEVGRVEDPAAGSWYAEHLTRDLALAAWDRFRAIERNGGMVASVADGTVADELAQAAQRRRADVRRLRRPIVGVTEFPALDEDPPATLTEGRHAVEFERLRDRAADGKVSPIGLVVLDSPAAAADTAIVERVLQLAGLRTTEEVSTATVVCVCGLDGDPIPERLRRPGVHLWAVAPPTAGVIADGLIYPGCDAVAVLAAMLDQAGAPQ
ncbi:methylmalonyl-CoA mutase family protein [Micromonospora sp. NPDC023888]|uniref:methylmalonyl-CoA mutase family protein n=1 Tax=Micromonospora sp. NPDC023888 TaxID=3155607 RepID=UPI0033D47E1C